MEELLDRYGELLGEVDRWFEGCLSNFGDLVACGRGCSDCCRGLFDITLLDGLYLKRGFDRLPADKQKVVSGKAAARIAELEAGWPDFRRPWTLNHIPEAQWDLMMPEEDATPCPLLSENGSCRVYAHRPMTCRLNGIPLIDTDGEAFSDEWCTLNFAGIDPQALADIRYPFRDLFSRELLLFRELTSQLFGRAVNELDTIIPAAVFLDADMLGLVSPPRAA